MKPTQPPKPAPPTHPQACLKLSKSSLLFAAFLFSLLFAPLLGVLIFFGPSNSPKEPSSPSLTLNPLQPETLRLIEPTSLPSTPLVRMLLSQPSDKGYGSLKGSYRTKNILIVDSSNSQSWWLLPNNAGLVIETTDLTETPKKETQKYIGSLYEVITRDSNADGEITWEDDSQLFLSTSSRGDWKPVTPDSKKILVAKQLSPTQALVIYQTPKETRTKTLSLPTGETLSEGIVSPNPTPENKGTP